MSRLLYIILLISLCFQVEGATYYSRLSGNWGTASTWSTVNYGGVAASGTPSASDTVKVGNTYTVTVNTAAVCTQLDIGQGVSGIVQFSNASNYSITVSGNVTVNAGGSFIYSSNSTKTHTLSIGGNFTNNGTVNIYFDSNDLVNTTFTGSSTSTVSGAGTWALGGVTIGKTSSTDVVDVQVLAFENGINTLTGTTGTYIHNNSGSYSVNSSAAADFTINTAFVFKVPQGTVTFSPGSTRLYLYGALYVTGGTVYVGSSTGTNGIRYDKTATAIPYLEVSSGSLTVYGGITYSSGAGSDPFIFNMSGGTMLLNCGSTGTSSEVFFVNDVASSSFTMSDGVITIQKHNSSGGSNSADWGICGSAGTVNTTGGTVVFGNSSTAASSFDFIPFANAVQPSFKVTGPTATAIKLQTSKGATANFKLLSLYIDTNKTFDITSISGTAGNTKIMTITSTFDGTSSLHNHGTFTARSGRVVLGGTSAQSIGGSSTISFYDLKISNSAGVTMNAPATVTDSLIMSSGILTTTSTNIITCSSSAFANIGSSTSYIDGPLMHTMAASGSRTLTYPIGKNGDYRPVVLTPTHSSATSVTYRGEVVNSAAAALAYALPSTLSRVSYVRYWLFTRAAVANFTSAVMQLYYGANDFVTDMNSLRVAEGVGANWADHGGVGTANTTGSITSAVFLTFNTVFTLGNSTGGTNPLPVRWLDFTAKRSGERVRLDWKTASEINCDYFTVQRSGDGIHYDNINMLNASGNSTDIHDYSSIDDHPLKGLNYYRIAETDFDGTVSYSSICTVDLTGALKSVLISSVQNGFLVNIYFDDLDKTFATVLLSDVSGKILKKEIVYVLTGNEHYSFIIPNGLHGGTCIVSVSDGDLTTSKKIIAGP